MRVIFAVQNTTFEEVKKKSQKNFQPVRKCSVVKKLNIKLPAILHTLLITKNI